MCHDVAMCSVPLSDCGQGVSPPFLLEIPCSLCHTPFTSALVTGSAEGKNDSSHYSCYSGDVWSSVAWCSASGFSSSWHKVKVGIGSDALHFRRVKKAYWSSLHLKRSSVSLHFQSSRQLALRCRRRWTKLDPRQIVILSVTMNECGLGCCSQRCLDVMSLTCQHSFN